VRCVWLIYPSVENNDRDNNNTIPPDNTHSTHENAGITTIDSDGKAVKDEVKREEEENEEEKNDK